MGKRQSGSIASSWSVILLALLTAPTSSNASSLSHTLKAAESDAVSPVRLIRGTHPSSVHRRKNNPLIRNIDGSGNNLNWPDMGAAHTTLQRRVPSDYSDGVSQMAGPDRPNPRVVSNAVNAHDGQPRLNRVGASDFLWQWGQFVDHDIDLTDGTDLPEPADIEMPVGDPHFDPYGTGRATMPFNRSAYDFDTGTGAHNPRQQVNQISAWIDASNVYGSDPARAAALRTNDGSGRLKTSPGRLLPFNVDGLPNAGGDGADLFLAGDVRANEQIGLTAMHTLFVREHNRLARKVGRRHRHWSGDKIYEYVRRIVGAEMQAITYNEYLPMLLGPNALPPYDGYKPHTEGSITNVFSTALYRYGHSALSPTLLRLDKHGKETEYSHLALRDAFFAPQRIIDEGGIEPLLRGLAAQMCEDIDVFVIDEVRNFLFGPPGSGGFDLASLNIQRGRDHGLPGYNETRIAFGLAPAQSFADVSSDPDIQARLASVYEFVDDIDVWVGGLAEDHLPGAMVGELIFVSLKEQFEALRDGDRFWYERNLSPKEVRMIKRTKLAHIIRRNTSVGRELRGNVFKVRDRHYPSLR